MSRPSASGVRGVGACLARAREGWTHFVRCVARLRGEIRLLLVRIASIKQEWGIARLLGHSFALIAALLQAWCPSDLVAVNP